MQAKLKELQMRNARYRNEIDKLKEENECRQVTGRQNLQSIAKAITVCFIKLGQDVETAVSTVNSILRQGPSAGGIISKHGCSELRNAARQVGDATKLTYIIKEEWNRIESSLARKEVISEAQRERILTFLQ